MKMQWVQAIATDVANKNTIFVTLTGRFAILSIMKPVNRPISCA